MKQKSLTHAVIWVAAITVIALSIPLVAMQFTNEVNWSITDYIFMGVLIFGTGLFYVLLTRSSENIIHRIAVALAILSTFLLVWINLAVGLIGSGPNAANLMYIAVVATVVTGAFFARFNSKKMERLMFTAAFMLVLIATIQLLAKMYMYDGSSVTEIVAINAFFAVLFIISALLFRYKAIKHLSAEQ